MQREAVELLSIGLMTIDNIKQFKGPNSQSTDTHLKYKV